MVTQTFDPTVGPMWEQGVTPLDPQSVVTPYTLTTTDANNSDSLSRMVTLANGTSR